MGASHKPFHSRMGRYSRRRRLLQVSCDMAASPTVYDEHVDEQILLDPKLMQSLNASADFLDQRQSERESVVGLASNLIQGSATGSVVLADFPDVECEISPVNDPFQKNISPEHVEPDSVFSDLPSQQPELAQQSEQPETKKNQVVTAASFPVDSADPSSLSDQHKQNPLIGLEGLNQVRGWLHRPEPRVWMFVGDETTAWLRYHGEPGYAEMFRHRIRWELRRFPDLIINTGIRGAGIDQLLKITTQGLLQCHAAAVFVMPGSQDQILAARQPDTYMQQLHQLVRLILQQGAEVVLQTPPIPQQQNTDKTAHQRIAAAVREVALSEGLPLIDHAEFWQEQGQESWYDLAQGTVTSSGQRALAMLFFTELDLFDRSSALCRRLQVNWNRQQPEALSAIPAIDA